MGATNSSKKKNNTSMITKKALNEQQHIAILKAWRKKNPKQPQDKRNGDNNSTEWETLLKQREQLRKNIDNSRGWEHWVEFIDGCGELVEGIVIMANPGEKIKLRTKGIITNNQGDGCIHQSLLLCGNKIVGELANTVPGHFRNTSKTVTFTAPLSPGPAMLWRNTQLQYSMRNARRNCERWIKKGNICGSYPHKFLGWVVVTRWGIRGWIILLRKLLSDKRARIKEISNPLRNLNENLCRFVFDDAPDVLFRKIVEYI